MGKINWTRVILGGLVAGLIINIFEYVLNGVVLARDMEGGNKRIRQADGRRPACYVHRVGLPGGHLRNLALRRDTPALRRGPKTALFAVLAVWSHGYLLAAATPLALNLFPPRLMVIGLTVGLVEVIVGTLAGAWLYREETD
jgi:hypothetical protein